MIFSAAFTSERPFATLIRRNHGKSSRMQTLALTLFVPRIGGTNHVDPTLAANNLALLANALDAGTNLHGSTADSRQNYRTQRLGKSVAPEPNTGSRRRTATAAQAGLY
jgi:hypothetical protein